MVLSPKAWKSRSLPGLPRTERFHPLHDLRCESPAVSRGAFCLFSTMSGFRSNLERRLSEYDSPLCSSAAVETFDAHAPFNLRIERCPRLFSQTGSTKALAPNYLRSASNGFVRGAGLRLRGPWYGAYLSFRRSRAPPTPLVGDFLWISSRCGTPMGSNGSERRRLRISICASIRLTYLGPPDWCSFSRPIWPGEAVNIAGDRRGGERIDASCEGRFQSRELDF